MRALLLAAGFGTRLKPLTDCWPKCLMPIKRRPLLEYWLEVLKQVGIEQAYVNTHFHASDVGKFLSRLKYDGWVFPLFELNLLGTAATISANKHIFASNNPILVIHADNWVVCDFNDFINYHKTRRPSNSLITMMTFESKSPKECGIVELDDLGMVVGFHEKVADPPGNIANGAVYIVEPEVISWMSSEPNIIDFSTQVLPRYIGKIATWHNSGIHRDIGSIQNLLEAQNDPSLNLIQDDDTWAEWFQMHPIHQTILSFSK